MNRKKGILIFIDWFYPAYKAGGPVKSVYNLIKGLEHTFNFYLVCSNQEINGKTINVPVGQWTKFDGIDTLYLDRESQKKEQYLAILKEVQPNVVYYNSLFSLNFTLKPLYFFRSSAVPQIIAPRGMFGEASLKIKPLKKKLFLTIAKRLLFNSNKLRWHATSKQEFEDIQNKLGKNAQISLARNLASPISKRKNDHVLKQNGELRLIFVSRIVPIKNLDFFLKVLHSMQNEAVYFDIYGPVEDPNFWNKCLSILEQTPNVRYCGELSPSEVRTKLQEYHFSVLPSKHENYGNSIAESWLSGVPVMISNQTPWSGLRDNQIGLELPINNLRAWEAALYELLAIDQGTYANMIDACLTFAEKVLHEESVLKDNKLLFQASLKSK